MKMPDDLKKAIHERARDLCAPMLRSMISRGQAYEACVKTADFIYELMQKREAEQLETLRMSLAACGVAALCNTEESIQKHRIGKDNPYWSASYEDVCDAVDREIKLRDEKQELIEALEKLKDIFDENERAFDPEAADKIIQDILTKHRGSND